jgi:hypothetical protein
MAIGGWYYVSASNFQGPTGSIQFKQGGSYISGSSNFTFLSASNTVELTGSLKVKGDVSVGEGINHPVFPNNQTRICKDATIFAYSRAVLYTDDDDTVTICDGITLTIEGEAKAILKQFPLS